MKTYMNLFPPGRRPVHRGGCGGADRPSGGSEKGERVQRVSQLQEHRNSADHQDHPAHRYTGHQGERCVR